MKPSVFDWWFSFESYFFMENNFPIYRKLDGFNRFYQIKSNDTFVEVSIQQGEIRHQTILAVQFPEKLRIQDMIACDFNYKPMTIEEIEIYFP